MSRQLFIGELMGVLREDELLYLEDALLNLAAACATLWSDVNASSVREKERPCVHKHNVSLFLCLPVMCLPLAQHKSASVEAARHQVS